MIKQKNENKLKNREFDIRYIKEHSAQIAFKKKRENLIRAEGQLRWNSYHNYISVKKVKEITTVQVNS